MTRAVAPRRRWNETPTIRNDRNMLRDHLIHDHATAPTATKAANGQMLAEVHAELHTKPWIEHKHSWLP